MSHCRSMFQRAELVLFQRSFLISPSRPMIFNSLQQQQHLLTFTRNSSSSPAFAVRARPIRDVLRCLENGQENKAIRLIVDGKLQSDNETFTKLIIEFCDRDTTRSSGINLLMFMQTHHPDPDFPSIRSFEEIIERLVSHGCLKESEEIINQIKITDPIAFLRICKTFMRAAFEATQYDSVISIFNLLKKNQIVIDSHAYSVVVSSYTRNRNLTKAYEIVVEMLSTGVRTDASVFNTLINGCAKELRWGQAFQLFDKMKELGIPPSKVTYNCLINMCAEKNDPERALQLFKSMVDKNHTPDTITINSVIKALTKSGRVDEALKIFNRMETTGFKPTLQTFTSLLHGCSIKKDISATLFLFDNLKLRKLKPDLKIYNSVIDVCSKTADLSRALEILKEMDTNDIKPDAATFNTMLDCCFRINDSKKFNFLLDEMQRRQIEFSFITHEILILGFLKIGKQTDAVVHFRDVYPKYVPTRATFKVLLQSLSSTHAAFEPQDVAWVLNVSNQQNIPLTSRSLYDIESSFDVQVLPILRNSLILSWNTRCRTLVEQVISGANDPLLK